MGEDSRAYPEAFEVAEGLWLHAYQTLAARLPVSDRPPQPRPPALSGLSGLPEPPGQPPPASDPARDRAPAGPSDGMTGESADGAGQEPSGDAVEVLLPAGPAV